MTPSPDEKRTFRKYKSDRCTYCTEFHPLSEKCKAEEELDIKDSTIQSLQEEVERLKVDHPNWTDKVIVDKQSYQDLRIRLELADKMAEIVTEFASIKVTALLVNPNWTKRCQEALEAWHNSKENT